MESMNEQQLVERLTNHGIKPTAMRLVALRALMESQGTLSLKELEDALYPADRSTLFRSLTLFQEHHLVHVIEDGTGAARYEICMGEHDCSLDDQHIHFHCSVCGRTYCLHECPIPSVNLPAGFVSETMNCVVTGLCAECAVKK